MTDEELQSLLRDAIDRPDPELKRDLWPAMRPRLEQPAIRISAFDWALIAAVIAWGILFPNAALALLYHL
jgi:hypothetical protein